MAFNTVNAVSPLSNASTFAHPIFSSLPNAEPCFCNIIGPLIFNATPNAWATKVTKGANAVIALLCPMFDG